MKNVILITIASLGFFLGAESAFSNELILSEAKARALGFIEYPDTDPIVESKKIVGGLEAIYSADVKKWPFEYKTIGNAMAQFQPYFSPGYFHRGVDMLVNPYTQVYSPVDGKIEAGHYSYSVNSKGYSKKFWKPWPGQGDEMYFEVAVVDENGFRYEFHHMDKKRLPSKIVSILNGTQRSIKSGELLGEVGDFFGDYTHVHYNVFAPDKTILNPESLHDAIPDGVAPQITHVFANYGIFSKARHVINEESLESPPSEFIVRVSDRVDGGTYEQPPVVSSIEFETGHRFEWDFRSSLTHSDGGQSRAPSLFSFIVKTLKTTLGVFDTEGGYGRGSSLIRLKVPKGAHGKFVISCKDRTGNITQFHGSAGKVLNKK